MKWWLLSLWLAWFPGTPVPRILQVVPSAAPVVEPALGAPPVALPYKWASVTTNYYHASATQAVNIEITASRINGTLLRPGQIFNYYRVVGPYTAANGYGWGRAFLGDRSLLGDVKGAGAVEAGKAQYISGMAETGPRTLQITLTKPVSNWVWRLANPALGIVPVSDLVHGGAYWSIADLIGTGPFRVVADAPTAAMQFEPLGARARTPLIELERYGNLEEAALALVNGEASAVSVPVRSLGAMLVKPFRPHLRFLAATPQIELVINPAAANPWAAATANGPAIGRVVRAAFHGLVPSAPGFIPSVSSPQVSSPSSSAAPSTAPPSSSSPPARAPLPLYVDGQDAMAMAIAASLERTVPGFYRVTVLSGPAWTTALQHGSIPAALVRTWPGGPLPAVISSWKAISLAPSGSFWLLAPQVRAASVLANGALDWNMFTSRHG